DAVSYIGGTAAFTDKNAGVAKAATATGLSLSGADAGNYTVNATATTAADITPLALTGSITAASRVYNGSVAATIASRSVTGVLASDSVSYAGGTAAFADKNVGTGKVVTGTGLGLAGADAANYTVNSVATTTANVTTLAITGSVTVAPKVYDGTTVATITGGTLNGAIAGDSVTYGGGTAAFVDPNAGLARIVTASGLGLSGADAANYTVNSNATANADITPRPLTVTANAGQTKVYGDADPASFLYAITSGNLVAGDTLTGALSRSAGENVGSYTILRNTLSGGPNYGLTYASNPFAITAATLTYDSTQTTVEQGSAMPALTGAVLGFKRGDTLASATTGTLSFVSTVPNTSAAGIFPIDGQGLTANMGNYVFVQDSGNATALLIAPAATRPGEIPGLTGAIASTLQDTNFCSQVSKASACTTRVDAVPTRAERLAPGAQTRIPLDGASFTQIGAGVRLPVGVADE
ncbi:MAG TPA: YDG domain-containing protein, partial [Pseudomonadales bacterium]